MRKSNSVRHYGRNWKDFRRWSHRTRTVFGTVYAVQCQTVETGTEGNSNDLSYHQQRNIRSRKRCFVRIWFVWRFRIWISGRSWERIRRRLENIRVLAVLLLLLRLMVLEHQWGGCWKHMRKSGMGGARWILWQEYNGWVMRLCIASWFVVWSLFWDLKFIIEQ